MCASNRLITLTTPRVESAPRSAGASVWRRVWLGGLLLAAAAWLYCPPALGAEAQEAHEADPSVTLLVASRLLENTIWQQTVVLVTRLPQGVDLGIILNRPTEARLGELFPDDAASQRTTEPVYFGGPVALDAMVALVDSATRPSTQAIGVARGVYLAVEAETIDRVIEERPEQARFYVGVAIWPSSALEQYIAEGIWSVREADPGIVFRKDTDSLWSDLAPASDQPAGRLRTRGDRAIGDAPESGPADDDGDGWAI